MKSVEIKNKPVLEVGPGTGNLTTYILKKKPKKLYVVEKDNNLAFLLNKNFKGQLDIINNGNSVLADNAEITIPSENIFIKSKKLEYDKAKKILTFTDEVKLNDKKNQINLESNFLKRHVVIIWVITVHCATKSIVRTRKIWCRKGIFFVRIHLRLEFEWGIKVIQVIKFTQSTHKF